MAMAGGPGGPGSAASSPSLQPGVIIKGKWKVVKKIGQGAFGGIFVLRWIVVYLMS